MLTYHSLQTDLVRALQNGAEDANGMPAERKISDGPGNPCRHCLKPVPEGAEMLVLAHRPFPALQPYAECGPIFLCADLCEAPSDAAALPEVLRLSPDYLIKGYSADDRIVYGTGAVVPQAELGQGAKAILARDEVAYVHARSARNNCYLLRIENSVTLSG